MGETGAACASADSVTGSGQVILTDRKEAEKNTLFNI